MKYKKITSIFLGTILLAGGIKINNNNVKCIEDDGKQIEYSEHSNSSKENEIEIWVPWYEGSIQWNALSDIVDYWNTSKSSIAGFEVRLQNIDGAYGGLTSQVQQNIEAGENGIQQLPDIYICYSDTTSNLLQLGDRNLAVDLSDESLSPYAIDSDIFVPGAAIDATLLAGSESDDALYSIPMAMSSEVMSIDVPLFIWMLQQFENRGGTIEWSGSVMDGVIDASDGIKDGNITNISNFNELTINESDLEKIESFWEPTNSNLSGKTLTINDDVFDSAKGLLELSNTLLLAVKDKNQELSKNPSQGIIGYDSIANNFYIYGQQITQSYSNPEDGLLSIKKDPTNPMNDTVQINMVENDENGIPKEAQNAAKEIYDFFISGYETGAIWATNEDYAYGSDQFKNHQLLFSIGSTAGATYCYTESQDSSGNDYTSFVNPEDVFYTQSPGHFEMGETTKPVRMSQGPVFGAIDKGDEQKVSNSIEFLSWMVGTETANIGDLTEITPSDYLSVKSGYIVGTTNVLSNGSAFVDSLSYGQTTSTDSYGNQTYVNNKYSVGPMIAYQNFAEAESGTVELEVEPYGLFTSAFRGEIESQIKINNKKILQGSRASSSDKFIKELHNTAIRNAWITGDIWGRNNLLSWWAILLIILGTLLVFGVIWFLIYYFIFRDKNKL